MVPWRGVAGLLLSSVDMVTWHNRDIRGTATQRFLKVQTDHMVVRTARYVGRSKTRMVSCHSGSQHVIHHSLLWEVRDHLSI